MYTSVEKIYKMAYVPNEFDFLIIILFQQSLYNSTNSPYDLSISVLVIE